MAAKRSAKKTKQSRRRGEDRPDAALAMTQRLVQGGPEYLQQNFIHWMEDSARLQQEPEFSDFCFDLPRTLAVATRQFARFKGRLVKAIKADQRETFATTYDDYRIAAVAELATPEFKRQLIRRLEQCGQRLGRSKNTDLFETATVITVFLNSDKIGEAKMPLGVYGLVTGIYETSFDRAMREVPEACEVVSADLYGLWQARHQLEDLALLDQAVAAAATFDELLATVMAEPALVLALQRQEDHLIEEFEQATITGELPFDIDFFTPAETYLAIEQMECRYLSRPWSLSRYLNLLTALNFTKCLAQVLDELATPQRQGEATAWWQATGRRCFDHADEAWRKFVLSALAVIQSLQHYPPQTRSRVLMFMYMAEVVQYIITSTDQLSPVFVKSFKRVEKSLLLKKAFQ